MSSSITIPNRFESLVEIFGNKIRPLIVPVDADIAALLRLREQTKVQAGGVLVFLLGESGVGKTTAVHAAAVNHPEAFSRVVPVPPAVRLRDVVGWLLENVPKPGNGESTPVLFDGREVSDDEVGLRQLIAGLNQFLRQRRDVLFVWPTTDTDWHQSIRSVAESVGGTNLVPLESDYQVIGPARTSGLLHLTDFSCSSERPSRTSVWRLI